MPKVMISPMTGPPTSRGETQMAKSRISMILGSATFHARVHYAGFLQSCFALILLLSPGEASAGGLTVGNMELPMATATTFPGGVNAVDITITPPGSRMNFTSSFSGPGL